MGTLQSIIFIEFDVNTKKITFLRNDNIVDYDSNVINIYLRVKYKNLSGDTVYLTSSDLEKYDFSLYTIKPTTNDANIISGEITYELKNNINGGVVKFEIPRTCTNRLGIVKCEIHINEENKRIASSRFILDIKQSLVAEFDNALLEDEDFPVLKQLIFEVQKVQNASNIDDAIASANTTYSSNKIESIKEDLISQIRGIGGSGGDSTGGSGEVDLSGYVTRETGNANQITFADGQTFQAKLDAGILKGDKGDKGDTGATEAREVSIEDTGNNFVATNVENALAELFQITSELANKISQILGSTIKINSLNKLSKCKFKLINSTSDTNYNSIEEANKSFNDNSWNTVSIPHDWSIYNDFNQNSPASYDAGYLDGGDAWYRFKLNTDKLRGQKIYIYFDGVYMESDVYINGTKVKVNKWYNPFYVDATDYLEYDNNDVLAVFVRNQQPSSRWYSGSGIIRNVSVIKDL